MNIEEILSLERKGLIDTINDYTREHYIRSYTDIFSTLEYPKDKTLITKVVHRLLEWYEDNIYDKRENKHIYNRKVQKIQSILKVLLSGFLNSAD